MHPLRSKRFKILLGSRLLSMLSLGFFEIPVIWWVLEETNSASLVAQIALVGALAYIVAAPFGGGVADRKSKKQLIIFAFVTDGVLTALAGLLLLNGSLTLPIILLLLAITNLAAAFRSPALGALLPLILEEDAYRKGNATMGLATTLASLFSFAAAGIATGLIGSSATLFFGAGLLFAATILILFFEEPVIERPDDPAQSDSKQTLAQGLAEGARIIFRTPLLMAIVVTAAMINFILSPLAVLFAPLARSFQLDASGFGALSSAIAAGQFLGLILMNFVNVPKPLRLLLLTTIGMAAALLGLAYTNTVIVAIIAILFLSLCASLMGIELQVMLQKSVKPNLLGRAYGLMAALSMGAQPAGFAASGALLAVYPLRNVFLAMSGLMVVASLSWLRPSVKKAIVSSDEPIPAADGLLETPASSVDIAD